MFCHCVEDCDRLASTKIWVNRVCPCLQQIQHVMCHACLIFYANNACCCDLSDTCQATKTLRRKTTKKSPHFFLNHHPGGAGADFCTVSRLFSCMLHVHRCIVTGTVHTTPMLKITTMTSHILSVYHSFIRPRFWTVPVLWTVTRVLQ